MFDCCVLEPVLHRAEFTGCFGDGFDLFFDFFDRRLRRVSLLHRCRQREGRDFDLFVGAAVGADLKDHFFGSVQEFDAVERSGFAVSLDLFVRAASSLLRSTSCWPSCSCRFRTERQLTDALEHLLHRVQRTLGRLCERNSVLAVLFSLFKPADLRLQLLVDGVAGDVVGGRVDASDPRTAVPSRWPARSACC